MMSSVKYEIKEYDYETMELVGQGEDSSLLEALKIAEVIKAEGNIAKVFRVVRTLVKSRYYE